MQTAKRIAPPPLGAKAFISGAYHKIGINDRVYVHNGLEWVLSSKTKEDYYRSINKNIEDFE